jgi:DNA-binding transcriptional MocR family regulator
MDICPPALSSAMLTDFIAEGHFARHLRRTSLLYRERRTALVEEIREKLDPRLKIVGAEAGIHLENSGTPYPTPHDNPAKARDPVGRVGRLSCVWCPRNPARQTNGV